MLFAKKIKQERPGKGLRMVLSHFVKASGIRKDNVFDRLEEYMVFSEERIEISGKIALWHKSCFSSYASGKNLASVQLGMEESEEGTAETTNISSNTESSGRPATRVSLDATVNWELCIFSRQASYTKDRKLYNVTTYDGCTKTKAATERQQDQRILTIVSHDEFVLIPYEGKYHKGCHSKYLQTQKKESGDGGKVSEYDSAF